MNKIGLHIINGTRLNLGRPRLVKLVNCSVEYVAEVRAQIGPQALIIVRFEFDNPSIDHNPEQQARDWYARRRGDMLAMKAAGGPNIAFESACNEVPTPLLGNYVRFSLVLVPLMHADGLRVVWGNCSIGEWHEDAWPQAAPVLRMLRPGDYLGVHEYWVDTAGLENRWHVARWTQPQIAAVIGNTPIVVTECGRDIILENGVWRGARGWKQTCDAATFLGDLRRYNQILEQFPQVLGATVFTAGGWWSDYDPSEVWPQVVAGYSNPQTYPGVSVPAQPPVTPPPPKEEPVIPATVTAPGVVYKTPSNAAKIYQSPRAPMGDLWLVIHGTEGPRDAAFAWWASANNPGKSSAHDLIDWEGMVWRCVPYSRAAHHCGGSTIPGVPAGSTGGVGNVNHASIGIELECDPLPNAPGYTTAQFEAAVKHVKAMVKTLGIPRERIVRHLDIDEQKCDPRAFDWEGFLDMVFDTVKPPTEAEIRKAAWNAGGIPYNPDAAFPKYAREHELGNPVTPEFDFGQGCRGQGFSGGIVWARIGHWGECQHVSW